MILRQCRGGLSAGARPGPQRINASFQMALTSFFMHYVSAGLVAIGFCKPAGLDETMLILRCWLLRAQRFPT